MSSSFTFTFLDWIVIQNIEGSKKRVPNNIEILQRLTSLFAILPNPKYTTLLEACSNKIVQINDLFAMWKKYHKDFLVNAEEDDEDYLAFIPILPNLEEIFQPGGIDNGDN